ncbi:MAG: uracil-DNA glycosylase [Lachnospiraceae bacterium]|nr:uracil-DNA glycosylase [Lachnospiraceae bacterium]
MNVGEELQKLNVGEEEFQFSQVVINPETIRAVMINEIVPADPADDFYGGTKAAYMSTTIPLFQKAGIQVNTVQNILDKGIYITNAVKISKTDYTVAKESIEKSLPYLERELALFSNVKVIMLMGDVAKKAFNMISKKETRKNAVPSISTYKLRHSEIFYKGIRIIPSYIMTGKNLLIEKSKFEMASEDIAAMYKLIME